MKPTRTPIQQARGAAPAFQLPPRLVRLAGHSLVASGVDDRAFLERVRGIVSQPCSAVLLSGGDLDCSRYSMAAWDPFLVFRSKGQSLHLWSPEGESVFHDNPLTCLDALFDAFSPDFPLAREPFSGGAVGYFAYDLKNQIERLPQTAEDDLQLPDIFLIFPQRILIHDRLERNLYGLTLERQENPLTTRHLQTPSITPVQSADAAILAGALQSNFTHEDYLRAIKKIRDYIRQGDVYQVNLSQRFQFPFQGDPFRFWEHLFSLNPAPFYAYVNAGDHCVLSTSMERFLFRRGAYVETRPIKGTRKRGKTLQEDEALRRELRESPKDSAELSMIVDLLRNDLGRICRPRSVRVAEHKRLESYQNVHHLVSIVTGELREATGYGEILRATFPGGSITGCPKIRAMEIIDELEPQVRHVYTGAIGYLGWHENMDLNVAIRTALVREGMCSFSVGGGIVYDSEEQDEYQETLHKARTLFDVLESLEQRHGRI